MEKLNPAIEEGWKETLGDEFDKLYFCLKKRRNSGYTPLGN
jgi:hypothetical protein